MTEHIDYSYENESSYTDSGRYSESNRIKEAQEEINRAAKQLQREINNEHLSLKRSIHFSKEGKQSVIQQQTVLTNLFDLLNAIQNQNLTTDEIQKKFNQTLSGHGLYNRGFAGLFPSKTAVIADKMRNLLTNQTNLDQRKERENNNTLKPNT